MPEKNTPTIRLANLADCQLLADLGARTFAETFAVDNTPEDMSAYLAASFSPEQLAAELNDSLCTFLIADVQGIAAGYAMLRAGEAASGISGEKPIEIVRFYVSREWHGLGIGEGLMRGCIDQVRQRDYQTLWLGVWEHNARARAFYRKWKFQDVGTHVFQLGADLQNDILMQRGV